MIQSISHLAIAVPDIAKARDFYKYVLGGNVSSIETQESHGVKTCFIDVGGTHLELLEPFGDASPLHKFLIKNPKGGLHHLCFTVQDVHQSIKDLTQKGCQALGDPKVGAKGHLVVFLHPKDTYGVLIELEQAS